MSNLRNLRNRRNTNNLEKGLFYSDSDFDILIDDNEGYCYKLYKYFMDLFYINNKKVSDDILKEKITDDNNLTIYINKCFQMDSSNTLKLDDFEEKVLEKNDIINKEDKEDIEDKKYRIEKYLDYEIFTFGNDDYYYYD